MRNRGLVVVFVILICLAFALTGMAATTKNVTKHAKPAVKTAAKPVTAKPAEGFDLDATLGKYWKLPDSTIVGTVDGVSVTKGELMKALWYGTAPAMLDNMLTSKMVVKAAKKQGVTLTPADIKAKIADAAKQANAKSLDDIIRQNHLSKSMVMDRLTTTAYVEKAASKSMKVSDADLAQYIKIRHILVQFSADETDQTKKEQAAKTKIDEVVKKLKDGTDFAKLAEQYSDDPGSKSEGGELGWINHGRTVPEFEKAAFDLKVGQISDPVKTVYGYHVIQLEALGKDVTGKDKEDLRKKITDEKGPTEMQQWFQKVSAAAKKDNKLSPPTPKEPTPAKPAERLAPPPPPGPGN